MFVVKNKVYALKTKCVVIKMFTVFVHSHLHTLLETTRLALVAMCLVDHTASGARLASVSEFK